MDRTIFAIGAALAFLAVGAGAFGAHALAERLSPDRLATWELASRYQMYHALALLALAWASRWPDFPTVLAAALFLAGIAIFSGTLYALALGGPRWLGAVTPVGGTCLLAAWATMVWGAVRS